MRAPNQGVKVELLMGGEREAGVGYVALSTESPSSHTLERKPAPMHRILAALCAVLLTLTIAPPAVAVEPAPAPLVLAGVHAERDALAASGLAPGLVYRSARLCKATAADRAELASLLAGGLILDLRGAGKARSCKDPVLPGVTRTRYGMTGTSNTATLATRASDRRSLAAVLRRISTATGPVLIHCTHGRDRTGWTVTVLLSLLGADTATVRAEYLRTSGAHVYKLNRGLAKVAKRFGSGPAGMARYATASVPRGGLGLSPDVVATLRARLG